MEKLLRKGFMRALLLVMLAGVACEASYSSWDSEESRGAASPSRYSEAQARYSEAQARYSEAQVNQVIGHVAKAEAAKKKDLRNLPQTLDALARNVEASLEYTEDDETGDATDASLTKLQSSFTKFKTGVRKAISEHEKTLGKKAVEMSLRHLDYVAGRVNRVLGLPEEEMPYASEPRDVREDRERQAAEVRERQAAEVARLRARMPGYTGSPSDQTRLRDQFRFEQQYREPSAAVPTRSESPVRRPVPPLSPATREEMREDVPPAPEAVAVGGLSAEAIQKGPKTQAKTLVRTQAGGWSHLLDPRVDLNALDDAAEAGRVSTAFSSYTNYTDAEKAVIIAKINAITKPDVKAVLAPFIAELE